MESTGPVETTNPFIAPKNLVMYWSDDNPQLSILSVFEDWKVHCFGWNCNLLTRSSASSYVRDSYGSEIASLFEKCRIPAMQADVIRLLWILEHGGYYSDFSFSPLREPTFHQSGKEITVARWSHGRIVNGIFSAVKGSSLIALIASQMIRNIGTRRHGSIWSLTGPGLWIATVGNQETSNLGIIDQRPLFGKFIKGSRYASTTRNTAMHWSEREQTEPLYEK